MGLVEGADAVCLYTFADLRVDVDQVSRDRAGNTFANAANVCSWAKSTSPRSTYVGAARTTGKVQPSARARRPRG